MFLLHGAPPHVPRTLFFAGNYLQRALSPGPGIPTDAAGKWSHRNLELAGLGCARQLKFGVTALSKRALGKMVLRCIEQEKN
jgi:hypothetical protein